MPRHVPHLYVPGPWRDHSLAITPDQHQHLHRVLRRNDGDAVGYTDGCGLLGRGSLSGTSIVRGDETVVSRAHAVMLAVAPTRSVDRNRYIVEKLQELAVARLTWLTTERGQGRVPGTAKVTAWVDGALEQSHGAWRMHVDGPLPVGSIVSTQTVDASGSGDLDPTATLLIGPEGGWSNDELGSAETSVRIADTVLRTETAAVVAAALAMTAVLSDSD